MTKHSATLLVDTEDAKALRLIVNVSSGTVKHKKDDEDTGLAQFMRPIRKQLRSLSKRVDMALLDADTPLGKGKESWE